VTFAVDAGAFRPERSGRIEYRLRTEQAAAIAARLAG
jgi:hypothetical protein